MLNKDGMSKKEFDKINEVYAIVLQDLQKWEINKKEIENDVKLFKFYKNDHRPFLGKLEKKNIRYE